MEDTGIFPAAWIMYINFCSLTTSKRSIDVFSQDPTGNRLCILKGGNNYKEGMPYRLLETAFYLQRTWALWLI